MRLAVVAAISMIAWRHETAAFTQADVQRGAFFESGASYAF
jgi:hypothetical protein